MNRVLVVLAAAAAMAPLAVQAQTLAFPGAEGFGRYASGARTNLSSASIYHVTNLNDSGSGSLRDALSQPNRFVVFDVGGIIELDSVLTMASNITIAGQTAPGGITVYGDRVAFHNANNLVSRHWAIRKGEPGVRDDAASIARGSNMIFDHMSITWGVDGTLDINADSGHVIDDITIQNSIIAQGLDRLGHSTGGLMQPGDGGSVSVIKSLWADNVTRNPKVRAENEFINNVVYGWEDAAYIMGDTAGTSNANVVGNYFIEGPVDGSAPFSRGTSTFHIYAEDNWVDTDRDGVLDGTPVTSYPGADVVATPHAFPTTAGLTAQEAVQHVMEQAGPNVVRDAVDTRLMQEVASYGTLGGVIQRETDLFPGFGSDPAYLNPRARLVDSDGDAMPDNWETANGLSPADGADWKGLGSGGYTRLEEYLNELGADARQNTTGGGSWTSAATWNQGVPTLADVVTASGTVTHSSGASFARRAAIDGTLSLTGGTLDVVDTLSASGTVLATNGAVTAGRVVLGESGGSGAFYLGTGGVLQTGAVESGGGSPVGLVFSGGTFRALAPVSIETPTVIHAAGGTIDTNGYSGEVSVAITGAGGLTKRGEGELVLTAANAYTGPTTIEEGTLGIGSSAALGGSPLVQVKSGAVLNASDAPGGYTAAAGTTVTGAGSIAGDLTTAAGSVLRPAGLEATAEAVTLTSDADTTVRYGHDQDSNFGSSGDLSTRQNDTAPRDYMAYIRFDLSSVTTPITDATFVATKSGGDTLVGGRVRVLGLNNDAGNTDQAWGEGSLTWNTLGAEVDTSIYPGPAGGSSPLDLGRVTDFEQGVSGVTETILGGQAVEIAGATLIDFLEARRQDGGLATLILDFPTGTSDKTVNYASKEHGSLAAPTLTLATLPETFFSIAGDYNQAAGSTLAIDIGSDDFFNTLVVTDEASLAGDLVVSLLEGFTPQSSDEFLILDADSLVGQFEGLADGARIATADGAGSFVVDYDYANDRVTLGGFAEGLLGDFNGDGSVDAADYVVWRNHLGDADESSISDAGDGLAGVDEADLEIWRQNYGATLAPSQAVPEPTAAALGMLATIALVARRRG